MGSGLVHDGKDGEIGASYSLLLSSSLAYLQHAAFLPSSVDLRSLNRNGKLRHVFLSIGNSLQTAELNTALHSPLYTPGHGPIFHLD